MEQPKSISEDLFSPSKEEENGLSQESPTTLRSSRSIQTPTDDTSDHTKSPGGLNGLDKAMASLSVASPQSNSMFRTLASCFHTSQMYDEGIVLSPSNGPDIWTVLRGAIEAEERGEHDVAALHSVRHSLEQLLWAHSQMLLPALKAIADSSRDPSWRFPFGDAGILDFSLGLIASSNIAEELSVQALRLVGNSCADTDENRERVVLNHYLQIIMSKMESPQLASFAVPVVFNICTDYEPAQKQAIGANVLAIIVRVLERGTLGTSPALSYACRLLDMGAGSFDTSRTPDTAVEVLFHEALRRDLEVDDFVSLTDTAIAHLKSERFQKQLISNDAVELPLKVLVRSLSPNADLSGPSVPPINSVAVVQRDPEDEAELTRIRKALITDLSDVSALAEFASLHGSLETSPIRTLSKWLAASPSQLQLCACIMLGNLAQSDIVCSKMVSQLQLHQDLIAILRNNSDSTVVHSVLGFLRNLALPKTNKDLIGEAGAVETLANFATTDSMPQVIHAAAGLARQLVIGNLRNTERLLAPLSPDEESPASSKTYLSLLLNTSEKSDEIAIKTEVARIVAAILRCVHSSDIVDEPSRLRNLKRLYALHPDIGRPLGMMVTQTKYPVIRSEGWFAMALMARSSEGAAIVNALISDVYIFSALEGTIRGKEVGSDSAGTINTEDSTSDSANVSQTPEMRSKDRENALILLNELLQHGDEDLMANIRRSTLEDLMQAGSRVDPEE